MVLVKTRKDWKERKLENIVFLGLGRWKRFYINREGSSAFRKNFANIYWFQNFLLTDCQILRTHIHTHTPKKKKTFPHGFLFVSSRPIFNVGLWLYFCVSFRISRKHFCFFWGNFFVLSLFWENAKSSSIILPPQNESSLFSLSRNTSVFWKF